MISQPYLFHYPITHHHVQKIYRYSSRLLTMQWTSLHDATFEYYKFLMMIHVDATIQTYWSSFIIIKFLRWCQFAPPTNNLFNLQLLFIIFNGCEWFECQAKFVISFFQSCSSWIMIQVSTNLLFGCASSICHE